MTPKERSRNTGPDAPVTFREEGNACVITFKDKKLNFPVADPLRARLRERIARKLRQGCRHVILNLEAVEVMDSTGAGLLMAARKWTIGSGAQLHLCSLSPFVIKDLKTMRILPYLSVFATESDALKEIKQLGDA